MSTLRFRQLAGNRRILEFGGHSAPHGRPRQAPFVEDGLTVRESEVFVSGRAEPVRHLHGVKHEDWELNGRWIDRLGGVGYALERAAAVKRFVAEMQPVQIVWDDDNEGQISATGLITSFVPSRESAGEIAWRLVVKIDSDDALESRAGVVNTPPRPQDYTDAIVQYFNEAKVAFKGMALRGNIFDAFDEVISALADVVSFVTTVARDIQSFEEEAIGTLRRFRSVMGQLRTAALMVRDTVDAVSVDIAIEAQNYNEQFSFSRNQAIISDSALSLILEAGRADRAAQIAEQGQVKAIAEARGGDTFESLSSKYYGNAERAQDIRTANGIAGGQNPEVGALYIIPI